ncbi:hypothetical protein FRC17_005377 [Serendipita sp. 399]|nr:hypothetical protein FRC17_005377 [Serendipita sp. 399]
MAQLLSVASQPTVTRRASPIASFGTRERHASNTIDPGPLWTPSIDLRTELPSGGRHAIVLGASNQLLNKEAAGICGAVAAIASRGGTLQSTGGVSYLSLKPDPRACNPKLQFVYLDSVSGSISV